MGTDKTMPVSFFTGGKVGLWAHVTERLSGHLHDIKAAGFDYLLLKVADSASEYHHAALTKLMADIAAAKIDLPVAAWAYVKPDNPEGDAKAIVDGIPTGVNDIVFDAEIEWEQSVASLGMAETVQRVHRLCRYIQARRPSLRMHLSSFWSPKLHASVPFQAFLMYCVTWQPQVYVEPGGRSVENVVAGSIAEGRTLVSGHKRVLLPTINDPSFLPLLKAAGIRECNVYAWDPEGDAQVSDNLAKWSDAIKAYRS